MILNGQGEDNGMVENNNDRLSSKKKNKLHVQRTFFSYLFLENIHTTSTEGIGFSGGEGGQFAWFSRGEGGAPKGNISEGSRDA